MVLKIFVFAIFLQHVLGNCPVGYIDSLDGSRCYKVMVGATNWFTAEKQCAALGGHLSSIGDAFTNKYLRGIAETAFGTDTTFWLGGIKWPDPINWIWSDYGNFSYFSWAPGEPKTDNNLAAYMQTQTSLWYTSSIVTNYYSICEVFLSSFSCPGSTTTIPMGQPTEAGITEIFPTQGECPDGFSYFEKTNSCYYVLHYGDGLRWDDAENYCLNHSAKLASIHNLHETNFILSITGTTNSDNEWAWIGIYRKNIQSPWQWIDGTAVDFINWDTTVNPPTNNSDFLYGAINTYGGSGESELGTWTDAPIESIGVARSICKTPAFGLK